MQFRIFLPVTVRRETFNCTPGFSIGPSPSTLLTKTGNVELQIEEMRRCGGW